MYCKACGRVLALGWIGEYCASCEMGAPGAPRGESSSEARLRGYARHYGFGYDREGNEGSLRRFREHAKGTKSPKVLEIGHDRYVGFVYHSEPGVMRGPIPDVPTQYLIPPGTKGIDWEICSGVVSGHCYCCYIGKDVQHPWVLMSAEQGYSGVICKLILMQS